jgi:hypothetical protein
MYACELTLHTRDFKLPLLSSSVFGFLVSVIRIPTSGCAVERPVMNRY